MVGVGAGYEQPVNSAEYGVCLVTDGHIKSCGTCLPCLGLLDKILDKETGGSIMEISDFFGLWLGYLIGAAPSLILWIAVIVFATIMLRRAGGRAERFLVAGAGIEIAGTLLRIPVGAIAPWLFHQGYSITYISTVTTGSGIFLNVISMAGIICFIYAFWVKFKARKAELVESTN